MNLHYDTGHLSALKGGGEIQYDDCPSMKQDCIHALIVCLHNHSSIGNCISQATVWIVMSSWAEVTDAPFDGIIVLLTEDLETADRTTAFFKGFCFAMIWMPAGSL